MKNTPHPKPFTGQSLLVLLLIIFSAIVAANVALIYFANRSFTGVTNPRAYEEGLAYNTILQAKQNQAELGLNLTRTVDPSNTVLIYTLTTPQGPATPTSATLTFARPMGEYPSQHSPCTLTQPLRCPVPQGLAQGKWQVQMDMQLPTGPVTFTDDWMTP